MGKCYMCGGFALSNTSRICLKCQSEAEINAKKVEKQLNQPIGFGWNKAIKRMYCAPAQEEKKEMEPIERLAIAAEKYVEKCDENHPLHEAVMSANLKHLCGLMAPVDRSAILRQLHRDAALVALSGICRDGNFTEVEHVHHAIATADEFVRQYNPDAVIAEVVG